MKVGVGSAKFGVKQARNWFFQKREIIEASGNVTNIGLARCGALLRTAAQRSMRWRKSPSKPGQPPSARTDRAFGGDLRRGIVFWQSPAAAAKQSVIVGPVRSTRAPADRFVPDLMEFGGKAPNNRLKPAKVGRVAPIEIVGRRKKRPGAVVRKDWQGKKVRVVFAKVETSRMADRANKVLSDLYGPPVLDYAARPYMRPAYEATRDQYGKIFRQELERAVKRLGRRVAA